MLYNRVATVSIAAWDDQIVIYHHESGDTHLLESSFLPLAEICVSTDIISFYDLLNRCPDFGASLQQKQELINNFLQQFVHLNIINPINCEC